MDSDPDDSKKNSASNRILPAADVRKYVENRIELLSISIAEQVATAVSASIQKFVGLLFLSFGAAFLWIALGFFLGELLNSQALGFLIAALPLLIVGFIFYNRSSKNLEYRIQRDIIKKIAINFDETSTSLSRPGNDNEISKGGESS